MAPDAETSLILPIRCTPMTSSSPQVCPVPRVVAALVAVALLLALSACSATRVCAGGCTVSVDSPTGSETDDLGGFVPLLQSFDLRFVRGARPLRPIAVGALRDGPGSEPLFHLELQDGDGGDRMVGSARYFRWSEGGRVFFGLPEDSPYGLQKFVARPGCRSSCDLEIPDYGADTVLVITGFRFRFPDGENNLRSIGLELRGRDAPSPRTVVQATYRDDDGAERFDVELSYILFPSSWSDNGVLAGTDFLAPVPGPRVEVPLNLAWRGRISLLGGFRLQYGDGDEHVNALGVDGTDARVVLKLHDDDDVERIDAVALYLGFCAAPSDENVHIQEGPER